MNKWVMSGLVAGAAVLVGVVGYTLMGESPGTGTPGSESVSVEIGPADRVRGNPNAPITIVEYASFTCSHCAKFEREVMPHLVREYVDTGKVKLVYRDFPLDGAARLASALALCVPEDRYYSFVDLLLVNQRTWLADRDNDQRVTAEEVFEGLVQMGRFAGFNREKVESCINDQSALAHIDQTQADAQARYSVSGTPTFIINGEVVRRALEWEDLDKHLKDILAAKQ